MSISHRENNFLRKRMLVVILFVLSVTFFTTEVSAFNFPYGSHGPNGNGQVYGVASERRPSVVPGGPLGDPPAAVPEPTSILLLASGLGMVFLKRRSKPA